MTSRLEESLLEQKQQTKQEVERIPGLLGIPLGGQRQVEVPNRNSYLYVRLRNNQNEVIQAYNNQVAPAYNLPVLVERQGNRYVIIGVDTERYENNWNSFAPFLPRHGNTHSFSLETGGGGDIVWVYPGQIVPALVMPSGSLGAGNVFVNAYTLKKNDNTWMYVGNTGTADLLTYRPTSSTGAIMALVYLDVASGNPYLFINSGTVFSNTITGSSQIAPYIPSLTDPTTQIPLAAVRLITGTNAISWNNIYDVRQWIHPSPTGTGGGGSLTIQDEGVSQGTATTLNFVGDNVEATVAGGVARVYITGSTGGGINTGTLDARYLKLDASNDPVTGNLTIESPGAGDFYTTQIRNIASEAGRGALWVDSPSGSFGIYLSTTNNAPLTIDQIFNTGYVTNSDEPGIYLSRYQSDASPRSTSIVPGIIIDDGEKDMDFYGGTIRHIITGSTTIYQANPQATGTIVPYIYDTQYAKPAGTIHSSFRVQTVERAYVDVSGTFYSNGSPLIKEAPVNGASYVRKNAGWEVAGTGDVGGWLSDSNTWTYLSSDSPSFVVSVNANVTGTIGVGMKTQLTHLSATKNFFVTAISVTGSTSYLNLYGGTDYTLTTGSISNPKYSFEKSPFEFPTSPAKWTETFTDETTRSQATPSIDTWYNLGSLSKILPIGVWRVNFKVIVQSSDSSTVAQVSATMSTSNNSQSNSNFTGVIIAASAASAMVGAGPVSVFDTITLTSKTTFYFLALSSTSTSSNLYFRNTLAPLLMQAVCAYL